MQLLKRKTLTHIRRGLPAISGWDGVLALVALAVILALLLGWPGSLLDKADHAAYAVCHRIGDRSFFVAGRQLPLCARCSGTYLGALAGLIVLATRGRGRARDLPGRRYLLVLGLFFLAWGFDGANSYLTLFPGLPHLYEPHNLLRLLTGTLEGLAISALLLPVFNLTLWSAAGPTQGTDARQPSIAGWPDLAWLLVGGALVVAIVSSEWDPLLYPLALVSGLMIVGLVGAINGMLLMVLRRTRPAQRWIQAVAPLLGGVSLAMIELTAIGLFRAELTARLGLPF
jgi:uncharacterized membrane protein